MRQIKHWLGATRPDQQISFYSLMPVLALLLFIGTMFLLLRLLQTTEIEQVRGTLLRDTEWAQQSMRLHLQLNQDSLVGLARDISQQRIDNLSFQVQTKDYMVLNPELEAIYLSNHEGQVQWLSTSGRLNERKFRLLGQNLKSLPVPNHSYTTFLAAKETERTAYSAPYFTTDRERNPHSYMEVQVPVIRSGQFLGTVTGVYSILGLLEQVVPREITRKYSVTITEESGRVLASTSPEEKQGESQAVTRAQTLSYEVLIDPPGQGIILKTYAIRPQSELARSILFWLVIGLSITIIWSLAMLWRHTRRRMEAEHSRDRFFAVSLDILAILRTNGQIERINPATARLLDQPHTSLIDKPISTLIHQSDQALFQQQFKQLLEARTEVESALSFSCRAAVVSAQISPRWLAWELKLDLASKPAARRIYAVAHDITERKQAEAALIAETAFRRAMEDSMLTGMRAFDKQGKITYVNRAFCRMVGWEENELIGTSPPFPYWPEEDIPQQWKNLDMVLEGRAPSSGFEVRIQRRHGEKFDARMYVSPLIDNQGEQSGWMTSITDITEPKKIREELVAAHERFTTVLNELDVAISVATDVNNQRIDRDHQHTAELLFANRYYRQYFSHDSQGHQRLHAEAEQLPNYPTDQHNGLNMQVSEVQDPQTGHWYELRRRAIKWVDGRHATLQIATDITQRKQAEELARQQQEKLQLTSRLTTMGEMASSLAHELNQPLTAIANYCMGISNRVKQQSIQPDELITALEKTSQQAERAGKIIRRIREFVKRSEPNRRPCDLAVVIENAIGFAEIEAKKKNIQILTELPSPLPTVEADTILIEQVLLNLLKNAVEASDSKHPPLAPAERVVVLKLIQDNAQLTFSVHDRGTGIAPDHINKLFDPFFSTKAEGMGMGLNICRSIIEFHHGRLWVDSQLGQGSTFYFTLPR
ncbi:PAS domain S-box protein [Parvibium lacunae]|uniref:histidine kinase n=1 Tax=Parvibium lacunae TaxID=1888893 RepID=A0A368L733_9BURK|nr:PAS domain S-box protein [Parvibium lacunae]RCS59475.1 PAS domain S-box protein [Parvibium lacunae]